MATIPKISGNELIKIAKKKGFTEVRQSGSHVFLEHTNGTKINIVKNSRDTLSIGVLNDIIFHIMEGFNYTKQEVIEFLFE